jgi:TctA family transporter
VILNVPLIGVWVKVLQVPYRYMFPCALFFISIGVYSTNNSLFEVYEVLVFGVVGAIFLALDFPVAPILLGYVLGPLVEENFRRALLLSRGDLLVFFEKPISLGFMSVCIFLILLQIFFALRGSLRRRRGGVLGVRVPAAGGTSVDRE